MDALITVVDDESNILELVSLHLKRASFKVKEFQDTDSFFAFLERELPDLVISGFDVA
ncbi:MAG TPA: response regulator [Candidatus Omnitrophica bacterium]|nr:response regulator [Candidatus Omnitrophota bacterium]